jgi:hypothetical protein
MVCVRSPPLRPTQVLVQELERAFSVDRVATVEVLDFGLARQGRAEHRHKIRVP